jgi:RHS repeat-associated protein
VNFSYADQAQAAVLADGRIVVAGTSWPTSGYGAEDVSLVRLSGDWSAKTRTYVRQDANFNVTNTITLDGAVRDAGGAISQQVERYEYTPYGVRTVMGADFSAKSASTLTSNGGAGGGGWNYGFQGGRVDAAIGGSGMYNFRNRSYDPVQGRWTQEDPASYLDSLDALLFCGSEPLRHVDPSGLTWYDPRTWALGFGEAVGDIVGQARYGCPYQTAVNAAVNGSTRAQAAANAALQNTVSNASKVTATMAQMPGTGTGGPLLMPSTAGGSLATDAAAIVRDAEAAAEAARLEEYGIGGGHHVGAKSAFIGAAGYDAARALAIPNAELARLGISHYTITGAQATLYRAFAATGQPITWEVVQRIETEALVRAGMTAQMAAATVQKALAALKAAGVQGPVRIPWG